MTRRYFVPDLPVGGGAFSLSDEEARHAARVMRVQIGDSLTLFNGKGLQADARVQAIDKRACVVDASAAQSVDRELNRRIELAVALPKPDRAKEMVERLTELGVQRLIPLVCHRTQRPPTPSLLGKLQRVVVEACKQSERNVLMDIDPPVIFADWIRSQFGGRGWIAHPDGAAIAGLSGSDDSETADRVLIGPEGGFTAEEVAAAIENGYQKLGLGSRLYRVETAAVATAAILGVSS